MLPFALPAIVLILSTGCATRIDTLDTCPPLIEYDDAFENRLADELEDLPADSATVQFVVDAVMLRDMVRACKP